MIKRDYLGFWTCLECEIKNLPFKFLKENDKIFTLDSKKNFVYKNGRVNQFYKIEELFYSKSLDRHFTIESIQKNINLKYNDIDNVSLILKDNSMYILNKIEYSLLLNDLIEN